MTIGHQKSKSAINIDIDIGICVPKLIYFFANATYSLCNRLSITNKLHVHELYTAV